MTYGNKSPSTFPPPLTKGGRGDFASDCERGCPNGLWFDLVEEQAAIDVVGLASNEGGLF